MPKAVIVNYSECTGCRICELACSIRNEGAATGMKMTVDEFVSVAERIWKLVRMFNVREGFTRKDDTLPKRILIEPLPSGIAKGQRLTTAQLNQMLDGYYKLRWWNIQTEIPGREKLRELELDFVNV